MSQTADVLKLTGPQTVREVSDTYRKVVDHIDANDRSVIDVGTAGPVDALAVQLLLSALIFAKEHGKTVKVAVGDDSKFAEAMQKLGLIGAHQDAATIEDGLWIGLKEEGRS